MSEAEFGLLVKNATLALANGIAALGFICFADVRWLPALSLGLGFFAGGLLGPMLVRRLPAGPLRLLIATLGMAIAIRLGLQPAEVVPPPDG